MQEKHTHLEWNHCFFPQEEIRISTELNCCIHWCDRTAQWEEQRNVTCLCWGLPCYLCWSTSHKYKHLKNSLSASNRLSETLSLCEALSCMQQGYKSLVTMAPEWFTCRLNVDVYYADVLQMSFLKMFEWKMVWVSRQWRAFCLCLSQSCMPCSGVSIRLGWHGNWDRT